MRHLVAGRKLNRTSSHRKALMRNLATALFEHKKISTTEAKAKELRPFAEQLITKAKKALQREQQGLLPEGQSVDIHNRRLVGRDIRNKAVLQELFDAIAPGVADRPGGYTRIVKTGFRHGDAGRTAIIELVDWAAPQDGTVSLKARKKAKKGKAASIPPTKKSKKKPVEEEVIEEKAPAVVPVEDVEQKTLETVDVTEEIAEAPVEETVEIEPAPEAAQEDEPKPEPIVEEAKEEEPKLESVIEEIEPKAEEQAEEAPKDEKEENK